VAHSVGHLRNIEDFKEQLYRCVVIGGGDLMSFSKRQCCREKNKGKSSQLFSKTGRSSP